MPTELGRELSDRAFDEIRRIMRPGNPSIPVVACWVTSLLTMPWERLSGDGHPNSEGAPDTEGTSFRLIELPDERLLCLSWKGRLEGPDRRLVQLRVPRDCLLRSFSLDVSGLNPEDCRVTLTLPGRRELFTSDPHRLATVDHRGLALPWPGAILLRRGELLIAELEVRGGQPITHSHSRAVTLSMSYRSDMPFGIICVRPFCVALEGDCDGLTWDLPPGRSERVLEISPGVAGRLMAISADLGPLATEANLQDLGTGECLWKARLPASLSAENWGLSARPGWFVAGRRMSPGRRYGLRVVHNNPERFALPHAGLAEFCGIFLPARRDEWPLL